MNTSAPGMRRLILSTLLVIVLHIPLLLLNLNAQGIITTIAGGGTVPLPVGGPSTNAPLGPLAGVAIDSAGNVLASDPDNNRVVRISAAGVLTLVAGNGIPGFWGDGGPAVAASLAAPTGLAVDATGNIYIADRGNGRIRKVTPNGTIQTIAGGGTCPFSRVQVCFGGDNGPAIDASLYFPEGVAVDTAGNLYIADSSNKRIRKVSSAGIITTVAGNGVSTFSGDGQLATNASLNQPTDVAVDAAGNLYIADWQNNRIRKVGLDGIIVTIAGGGSGGDGGLAAAAALNAPRGVAVDSNGNLYIADTDNQRIRIVSPGGVITTVAGNGAFGFSGDGGPATGAMLFQPWGLAVDPARNLYIADSGNHRIRVVNPGGIIATIAGGGVFIGDGGPAVSAVLSLPAALALDPAGNVYIADTDNNRVRRVTAQGTITTVAGSGSTGIYGGGFSGDGGPAVDALLRRPAAVAVDGAGNILVADSKNNRIRKVAADGTITTVAGNGIFGFSGDNGPAGSASLALSSPDRTDVPIPNGLALDTAGNLYIADTYNQRIRKMSVSGSITTVAGNGDQNFSGDGGLATDAALNVPSAITLDAAGNLYIADTGNWRVRKVNPGGTITTVAGNGQCCVTGEGVPATSASVGNPHGLAVDAMGNLYISVSASHRIQKLSPDGTISTVAGTSQGAFSGDGGLATKASLNTPSGVTLDAEGNIYIADWIHNRVRKVWAAGSSAAPLFTANGVTNGASFITGVSPGAITTIFGTKLSSASGIVLAPTIPLPAQLRETLVSFDGIAARLFAVVNLNGQEQINLQVPYEMAGKATASVVVINNGVPSAPVQMNILAAQPGVFTVDGTAGAILHAGTYQLVTLANPAARGEAVAIFATGFGAVGPASATGAPAPASPLSLTSNRTEVAVGGIAAEVLFSGLAPGFVGLNQVNIRIPLNAPSGNLDLAIRAGDQVSKAVKVVIR